MEIKTFQDNDVLSVVGSLTVQSVTSLFKLSERFEGPVQRVDLGAVDYVDSSALALLIHWKNEVYERNLAIKYENIPVQLKELASLCDVESLISEEAVTKIQHKPA